MYRTYSSASSRPNFNKCGCYDYRGVLVPKDICETPLFNIATNETITLGELLEKQEQELQDFKNLMQQKLDNVSKVLQQLKDKINEEGAI
jgi:hypothetical protein